MKPKAYSNKNGDMYNQTGEGYSGIKLKLWGPNVTENHPSNSGLNSGFLALVDKTDMRKDNMDGRTWWVHNAFLI